MDRRKFIKHTGFTALAISTSGFTFLNIEGKTVGDCQTTTDMLGPFFRANAPFRNDLTYATKRELIKINVVGTLFGKDCETPMPNVLIDIWHCDERQNYDMKSDDYKCRGRFYTNEDGAYSFQTFIPPPYGGRPKHIHYLIKEVEGYQELVTQLYFKGDKKIKKDNWIKYPWDERRILDIYKNEVDMPEVRLDLYLTAK